MHLNREDSRREDLIALAPIIDKGKTILVEDSDSDNYSQVAPMDIPINTSDALALELTVIYTTTRAPSNDFL